MIRTITGCLSVIAIGLILMGCSSHEVQLTEEEKRYADDLSFCRVSIMERPELPPEAFAQCMASRGWREKVPPPPPPPRPRLTP